MQRKCHKARVNRTDFLALPHPLFDYCSKGLGVDLNVSSVDLLEVEIIIPGLDEFDSSKSICRSSLVVVKKSLFGPFVLANLPGGPYVHLPLG
ncbi:MAG: hypothetical protein BGO96_14780 [Micrococcales bacterium 73-15]|nr:MAG: hypothetical protein BGO96_14780 [Micrococcales bacterium 73-15]